jgi:hypothetical protein
VNGFLKAIATRLAWLAIAILVALGGAGIVATMAHEPGTAAREDLTWTADAAVGPQLDEATTHLQALSDEVDQLAGTARQALTQLSTGEPSALQETIDEGTAQLLAVQTLEDELAAALAKVPYTGDDWALHISSGPHERWKQLDGTAGLTTGLEENWATFTGRTIDAAKVTTLLRRHDDETAAAAKLGSDGKYKAALAQLAASDATIVEARNLRATLATSADVGTLTEWLDRNADYDAALRTLYAALVKSDGHVTADVKKAFTGEQRARGRLPGDSRGMVVIMSDIAQGGLNQAVIAIEEARGSLSQALDLQQQLRDGGEIAPPE